MHVTHLYTGDDGESHFQDSDIPLNDLGDIGRISEWLPVTGLALRETGPDYDFSWHNAPRRQYVVMLSGGRVEIEVGDGSKRSFGPGDITDALVPLHCARVMPARLEARATARAAQRSSGRCATQ
jgi:hypothetical protein